METTLEESTLLTLIAEELDLRWNQVKNTVDLLDSENTVPFIARYRKEATGSLDEEQIRTIEDRIRYLRNLEERKQVVLKSITEQGKLTPELAQEIHVATKMQEVEDLYLPYKPKRRTRAIIAKEKGLEPLSDLILKQEIENGNPYDFAIQYVNVAKGVSTTQEALAGARDIVAEIISDNAIVRKHVRELTFKKGHIESKAKDPDACGNYEIYKDFSEPINTIPPYRILAINRGEKENYLKVKIDVKEDEIIWEIEKIYVKNKATIFLQDLRESIADAYHRLIAPAIDRELRHERTETADLHAIQVFARNLKALLLTPPLKDKTILGIDPGYRTGCKLAVIDCTGKYLKGDTIYPHQPRNRWEDAKNIIKEMITSSTIDIIAIGNGTASRETEKMVSELLSEINQKVFYTIVNEAGASVYSASILAREEFPDLEASMRGNISIARRLMDPLSELVKIEPKSIGVGLYQHDVNQINLAEALDYVVESAVNQVGVNLNTASISLLKYVSGINSRIAENIVHYREESGKFNNRLELKNIKGLGDNAFTQAAGFLRIPDSEIFFDSTAVHPESYPAAQKLLDFLQIKINQVKENSQVLKMKLNNKSIEELASFCNCGKETLIDIIDCLEKPNRDPRDDMPKPILRSDVLSLNDLTEGMVLKGTVRNVVDFGAFVDIGVKQDGLVHLSRMSKKYVKNPLDFTSVGDVIDVKVIHIDKERGRIGLSMILD
jgi:protein Tex